MTLSPYRAPEAFELIAKDGFVLAARRFRPQRAPRGRLVVAGAAGVPQAFYARFATYAAAAGYEVVTFDYRGTGLSRRAHLKGFNASFVDWARLDLAAVVDAMPCDAMPLFLVGHSFGGHALGLIPNHTRLAGAWICGLGAGWAGWDPPKERVRLWLLWNVVFPPLVRAKGFMPMGLLGMGEDLPLGVYQQWRRWCSFPHYFLDDPAAQEFRASCEKVRVPIFAASATDDAWAPPPSRDAFLRAYPDASIRRLDIDPREHGGAVGHVGYFRSPSRALWDQAFAWFDSLVTTTESTTAIP